MEKGTDTMRGNYTGFPGKIFDIEPGEIALCDYSKPPDIHCRRVKTIGEVSDGFQTFQKLYAIIDEIWIRFCVAQYCLAQWNNNANFVWRAKHDKDGAVLGGYFLLGLWADQPEGMGLPIPMDQWGRCHFAETLDRAPEFDGHTSDDVLERLKRL